MSSRWWPIVAIVVALVVNDVDGGGGNHCHCHDAMAPSASCHCHHCHPCPVVVVAGDIEMDGGSGRGSKTAAGIKMDGGGIVEMDGWCWLVTSKRMVVAHCGSEMGQC